MSSPGSPNPSSLRPPLGHGRHGRHATGDARGNDIRSPGGPGRHEAEPSWLSIRQIAADLGVSTSTAYKWSARGAPWFPRSIRLHNGDIRVRRDWYEGWLASLEQDQ